MKNKNILQNVQDADVDFFRPAPFWSINSDIEEEELVRQIGEMHSYGLGGFVFHARTGLITEYLSEKWFYLVGVALETAKKYGMKVWIYDENGWPSGFVGGKLLFNQNFRAKFLRYKKTERYDESAYLSYIFEQGRAKRISGDVGATEYHNVYLMTSDSYTDILNPEVTDAFIKLTHEEYYKRFSSSFGNELIGFFTDEPQYYRAETPYPQVAEAEFLKTYGEDLKDGLVYLFVDNEQGFPFRIKYYTLLNRLYCENFYDKLFVWCKQHGCLLTGHSVEETRLTTQMWGGADCATSYLYEDIPAIDNLAKNMTAEISAKLLGSVCAQTGNKLALTETFGVSGYSTTPFQMKAIADKQYVYGVDMMVQHLYNYSLAGQGKIDCPPSFGRMMPWVSGYGQFNDYFARLGYLIANSEEIAPVAVIAPMESVYLRYVRLNEDASYADVDDGFDLILHKLRKAGVAYHFVNEKIAEKIASVRDGKLIVGNMQYSAVVVANCEEVKNSTKKLIEEYAAQGGKLCVEGRAPTYVDGIYSPFNLKSNCEIEGLPKPVNVTVSADVSISYRKAFGRYFLFIVNQSSEPVQITTEENYSLIDLVEMKGYSSKNKHIVGGKSSVILEKDGDYVCEYPVFTEEKLYVPEPVRFDKNNLTIEKAAVTLADGKRLEGYVYGVFETIAKSGYHGKIKVEFAFESDEERKIKLTVEKQPVTCVKFNGEDISFTQSLCDVNFEEAHVVAKKGRNVYTYEAVFSSKQARTDILYGKHVPESILNMTTYHTLMEQIYIGGDFQTDGYKLITPSKCRAGNLTECGYDNFYGCVTYRIKADASEKPIYIEPIGDYSQCIIKADGKEYRVMLNRGVLIDGLNDGNVEIDCYSTLRNMIGPFHFPLEEDDKVSPDSFTLRRLWTDEKTNKWYYSGRRLVPFGLNEVIIKKC